MKLSNFKLSIQLIIIFGLLALMITGSLLYNYYNMKTISKEFELSMGNIDKINNEINHIYKGWTMCVTFLIEADRDAYQSNLAMLQILKSYEKNQDDILINDVNSNLEQVYTRFSKYEAIFLNLTEQNENIEIFHSSFMKWKNITKEIIELINNNEETLASNIYYNEYYKHFNSMRNAMDKLTELVQEKSEYAFNESQMKYSNIKDKNISIQNLLSRISLVSIIIMVITILVTITISFLYGKYLSTPIKLITECAKQFSIGNFRLKGMNLKKVQKINMRNDELGDIGKAFNSLNIYFKDKMKIANEMANGNMDITVNIVSNEDQLGYSFDKTVKSLNQILGQVNASVNQINTGSIQVASASQALSQGATEQAASLEEITSSITEINSQSKQNAEGAKNVNEMSLQALEGAKEGDRQMQELVNAMGEINDSTEDIKKIAKTIDDIAFQINLLALNANVEAARAGKYGKGFAVVAEEVRNLAARSGGSVKEVTTLVEEVINNIDNSNRLVENTAGKIKDIVEIASKVRDIAEEVTVASNEQAQGLGEIMVGIGQIDQVTQNNTAGAEESAGAAEELAGQAELLKSLVKKFKLADSSNGIVTNKSQISKELIQQLVNEELERMGQITSVNTDFIQNNNGDKKDKNSGNTDIPNIVNIDDNDFGDF